MAASSPKTYFSWLWKSKIVRYLVAIFMASSVIFFSAQLVKCILESSMNAGLKPILRTYETNQTSPLSEMENSFRFSKMHPYISRAFTDRIYPYYFHAESEFNKDDVTVATFITQNRIENLVRLATMWKGPISAVLHLPSNPNTDPESQEIIDALKETYLSHPDIIKYVDIHLITGPSSPGNGSAYPIQSNFYINVARFFARSEFIFYLDHNTWPSPSLQRNIKENSILLLNNDVLIIPAFTFINNTTEESVTFPRTKRQVRSLVKNRMMGMQDYGWELNRGPTCMSTYFKSGKPYMIGEYDLNYQPNFVLKKNGHPWCTERFENNKAACLFQIYTSGSDLYVLHDGFVIQHNFDTDSHPITRDDSKWQKVMSNRMYINFSREMCLLYARQFVAMERWRSPVADHVKQECKRVLLSWGNGLIKDEESSD